MAYASINPKKSYFSAKLYTGNNSSSNAITGVGFQPDWTWIKARNLGDSHRLFDVVRGAANYGTTNATVVQSNSIPLTSFDSDGFTIGSSDGSVNGNYNYGILELESWNIFRNIRWNYYTIILCSISAASGFGIYKYTGTGSNGTIAHGLGTAPSLIIIKQADDTANWAIYYNPLGGSSPQTQINGQQGRYMSFQTSGFSTASSAWNDTAATSSVFSLGTTALVNESSKNIYRICFCRCNWLSKNVWLVC